ncbi:MAG: signal recognition particle protein [Bacteroidales bacterium]|nr:signal recognition particle protein [Bacteroidales bacterium]
MFERLIDRLDDAFRRLKGQARISEINIAETVKEIRRALIEADVSYKIAKEFTEKVKEKAIGQEVYKSVSPGQMFVKIVYDELVSLMGGTYTELKLKGNPPIVLLAGLQGSGKTTFAAKLAKFLKTKKSRNPMLVACDVYRPAAILQLKTLGEQIQVPVYSEDGIDDPIKIAKNAIQHAKTYGYNVVIVDTAGRTTIDQDMMNEIHTLHQLLQPSDTLFVVDSMTGQDAVNTARAFNDVLDYEGVVLTKLDGDARGGAALSIKAEVNKPILFASTGEKLDDIDIFYPDRMASRILGMGDIVSLVEKAKEQIDEEEARKLQKKIAKNQFNLDDFLKQLQQIKRMGNMKDLLAMIPGMGKAIKDIDFDDNTFKHIEAIIYSMTPEERQNPTILNGSRKLRIARGSGRTVEEVNRLLKQFEEARKLMHTLATGGIKKTKKH